MPTSYRTGFTFNRHFGILSIVFNDICAIEGELYHE